MRRAFLLTTAALAAAVLPTVAQASPSQEAMLQDDNHLIYATAARQAATLDTLKTLGVHRVRVTVLWQAIAPKACSHTKPSGFDATNPNAYGAHAWDHYDSLTRLAGARGIGVNFNVTGPAPLWATKRGVKGACKGDTPAIYAPSAKEFGAFVKAVGTRYSGSFVPASATSSTSPSRGSSGGLITLPVGPTGSTGPSAPPASPLPAVTYWSIWNEPNQGGWLAPQSQRDGRDVAPRLYRSYVDAAWVALHKTSHGKDTFLVGELAPEGTHRPGPANGLVPLRFLRDLYCVDHSLKPLTGKQAKSLGCPTKNAATRFPALHPALFEMKGFSTHPYALLDPPARRHADPDYLTLADLARLPRFLRGTFRHYGVPRYAVPLYLTEYGYQTKPPDPTQTYSPTQQAAFLNQAEYMAYRNPLVRTLSQFLLYDDPPQRNSPARYRWSTFQTGLMFHTGKAKASFQAYRLPLWLPHRVGKRLLVWASLRAPGAATVQFRRRGASAWKAVAKVNVRNARGYFTKRIRITRSGDVRVAGPRWHSRAVYVRYKR